MLKNIYNLGDSALYCDFGNDVSKEINLNVIKYFQILKNNKIDGITKELPRNISATSLLDPQLSTSYSTRAPPTI